MVSPALWDEQISQMDVIDFPDVTIATSDRVGSTGAIN